MPTYEYRCRACGHELEIVQSFSEDALTSCPSCGAEELRKVFGSVGISFKGSGFYKNDSRSKTTAGSSGSSSTSGTANGSASGSESSGSSNGGSDSAKSGTDSAAAAPAKPAAASDAKSA
ncbi:MAG: FmdB family zinc ribbon protein [Microthrixaceae bacterium]